MGREVRKAAHKDSLHDVVCVLVYVRVCVCVHMCEPLSACVCILAGSQAGEGVLAH